MNTVETTILGAQVPSDFHTRFRVQAATQGVNISDLLRDVAARELGFSCSADYVQFVESHSDHQSEVA